ncbi:MAG: tryptophan synthase subunit alpha [Gemmataceae bacterium]
MNRIDAVFAELRSRGGKALIPFLSAGDPDITATPVLAQALIDAGADLLEIGFPYSDPIADGPVIQASYTRALDRGLHLNDVFAAARQIADRNPRVPLAAMTSYSLVFRRGPETFVRQAVEAGFAGAIVPDLPVEEADGFAALCRRHDFKHVELIAPTTTPERARRILQTSTGFLYCVSIAGVTGVRTGVPPELLDRLAWLRTQTDLPLCVGFGISTPEHVRTLRDHADGVIVGSAFVRQLEKPGTRDELCDRLTHLARSLAAAMKK